MHDMHKQYRIGPSVSFTSQLLNVIVKKISIGVQQKLSNELQKGVFQVLTQVLTKIKSSGAWHRGDW
jgi:hypothetical protein